MKKWQIKIVVRNNYPYTNDTYDEIITEYYKDKDEAFERFVQINDNPNGFEGRIVNVSLKEIIKIKEVILDGK